MTTPITPAVHIEETDIDVEDWIDGVSFKQAKVKIHRNPAMITDLAEIVEEIDALADRESALLHKQSALRDEEDSADLVLGNAPASLSPHEAEELAQITARLETLEGIYESKVAEFESNVEVWTIRALNPDELEEIAAEFELPKPAPMKAPELKIPEGSSPEVISALEAQHKTEVAQYKKHFEGVAAERQEVLAQITMASLSRSVVSIDIAGSAKSGISVTGLQRLQKRPGGEEHYSKLVAALEAVTMQEVKVPSPKSLSSSGSDQE